MKVRFLGTSSTEGVPGIFCNCPVCKEVKEKGGNEIRTRTQAVAGDDLLIDFGPDTYYNSVEFGLRLGNLESLLITHSHEDHFYPQQLMYRISPYSHNMKYEKLNIYCNAAVKEKFDNVFSVVGLDEKIRRNLIFNVVKAFETFKCGAYTVTALPATHLPTEEAFIYLIEQDGKSWFYGNDTGVLDESVYNYLKDKNKKLSLVSLDCALGTSGYPYKWHLGYEQVVDIKNRMEKDGIADKNTKFVLTHISHDYAHKMLKEYTEFAAKDGITVAFGGMEVGL